MPSEPLPAINQLHIDRLRLFRELAKKPEVDALMDKKTSPTPVKEDQKLAIYIAMVMRNAMEDFHAEHLSDAQMKQLNPIIRNAICTALHAFNAYEHSEAAERFVNFNLRMVPAYWEPPELLDDYVQMWEQFG